ncbi:MAG TPA: GNAT family N-acetyltransferase [Actinophytocola sp.]|nr:GNAT family N-acetyltransferase [Actinophytocola sp.]
MSPVRLATAGDIPELVRLRDVLYTDAGHAWGTPVDGWRAACATALTAQLTNPDLRIVVVDAEDGLAACGIGGIDQRLPGPYNLSGRSGHVFTIVTDPGHRRRGHGRAVLAALLDWFDARGLTRVDMLASPAGQALYRDLGFVDHPDQAMRRIR